MSTVKHPFELAQERVLQSTIRCKLRSEKLSTFFRIYFFIWRIIRIFTYNLKPFIMYEKIFKYMKSLHNQGINDDAVIVERTAMELGLDIEEHEDLLFDCSIEVLGGNF